MPVLRSKHRLFIKLPMGLWVPVARGLLNVNNLYGL